MGPRIRLVVLVLAATVSALGLAACSSDESGGGQQAVQPPPQPGDGPRVTISGHVTAASPQDTGDDWRPPADGGEAPRAAPGGGPAIEVTWEALAHERYLLQNSRFRRPNQPMPPQRITLLSESHPDAARVKAARTREEREQFAHSAVLSDRDMLGLLRGLEQSGYFKYAKPLGYDDALADSSNARGRVLVKRDGRGWSLISMRGQGQSADTREIPRIYSESKQAVMVLRNMTPTLNVTHFGTSGTAPLR